jgi:hypothetical protein
LIVLANVVAMLKLTIVVFVMEMVFLMVSVIVTAM